MTLEVSKVVWAVFNPIEQSSLNNVKSVASLDFTGLEAFFVCEFIQCDWMSSQSTLTSFSMRLDKNQPSLFDVKL